AAYGEIFEAAIYETQHFVSTNFRLNELRVLFVEFQQTILKLRELEEVTLFRNSFGFAPMKIAEGSLARLLFLFEFGAARAIPTFVVAFVDVARVASLSPQFLNGLLVVVVRCANPMIVRQTESIESFLEFCVVEIGMLFFRALVFRCGLLNGLPVLVGSGKQKDIESALSFVAGYHIRNRGRVEMTHVRFRVYIIDRGR